MQPYKEYRKAKSWGYTVLRQLEFLKGEPFGDRILDFVDSLRPSVVEVHETRTACVHCDAVTWRVRIFLTEDQKVDFIEQEVEVGLRTADHGHGLMNKIPKGTFPEGEGIALGNVRAIQKLELKGESVQLGSKDAQPVVDGEQAAKQLDALQEHLTRPKE